MVGKLSQPSTMSVVICPHDVDYNSMFSFVTSEGLFTASANINFLPDFTCNLVFRLPRVQGVIILI